LNVGSPEKSDAQLNLIRAAAAASSVKRFVPSEFGIPNEKKNVESFPITAFKIAAVEELKKTNLEYTLFSSGLFLDYLGQPKVKSYLTPFVVCLDFQHKVAAIPGSGNTPVIFTRTLDVGRFVVASLDLEKWQEESIMVGDRKSWNEVLTIAETVTGSKFQTFYDPVDKLQKGQVTELPGHIPSYPFFPKEALQGLLATFGYWFETGVFNFQNPEALDLNRKFPEIHPTTVHQIISEAWA